MDWQLRLADLLEAILDSRTAEDAHDLLANYSDVIEDGISKLRGLDTSE